MQDYAAAAVDTALQLHLQQPPGAQGQCFDIVLVCRFMSTVCRHHATCSAVACTCNVTHQVCNRQVWFGVSGIVCQRPL
jgi:hypothetical protein